jgi:hypothetical protein
MAENAASARILPGSGRGRETGEGQREEEEMATHSVVERKVPRPEATSFLFWAARVGRAQAAGADSGARWLAALAFGVGAVFQARAAPECLGEKAARTQAVGGATTAAAGAKVESGRPCRVRRRGLSECGSQVRRRTRSRTPTNAERASGEGLAAVLGAAGRRAG